MVKIELSFSRLKIINNFKNLYCWHKKLSKNKYFEFEIIRYGQLLFEFKLDLNWSGRDHAGPEISILLLGYGVNLRIYDHRHWNYIENRWEKYNLDE